MNVTWRRICVMRIVYCISLPLIGKESRRVDKSVAFQQFLHFVIYIYQVIDMRVTFFGLWYYLIQILLNSVDKWSRGHNQKNYGINLPDCHFVHHNFHVKSEGIEPLGSIVRSVRSHRVRTWTLAPLKLCISEIKFADRMTSVSTANCILIEVYSV